MCFYAHPLWGFASFARHRYLFIGDVVFAHHLPEVPMRFLTSPAAAAAVMACGLASTAAADAVQYDLDPSHSQAMFSYTHLGMSTTFGMFSGFEGSIQFDAENPAASSVSVSIPTSAMFTGWEARDAHLQSDDFLGTMEDSVLTFQSTAIEITGDDTALITGDLTVNGETAQVVLDTVLNLAGPHPAPQMGGVAALGFTATTTLLRSDFGAGAFAPFVSDEMDVVISIEATQSM
jgi:polyisoprenoid-binding protein YceI